MAKKNLSASQRGAYRNVRTNSFSVVSFVFGLLFFIPFAPLIAIIFGFLGLSQIKHTRESGKVFAIAGIVLGFLWIVIFLLMLIFIFTIFATLVSSGEAFIMP